MKSNTKLIGIVALVALIGFSTAGCESKAPENNGTDNNEFVPVTDIVGVNTDVTVGTVSLSGRVVPSNATNKTIRWSLQSEGDTEGTTLSGNKLITIMEGYVIIRATIVNGKAEGENYTKNFNITIDPFVPVTYIANGPKYAKVGELILDGTVEPYNASNTDIVWSIVDPDTTRATLKGDLLTTRATGIVVVSATIKNGRAEGEDYTQSFSISIE